MRLWIPLLAACSAPPADVVASFVPDDYAPTDIRTVVFLGDGITSGNGASDDALAYRSLLLANHPTWTDADPFDLEAFVPDDPTVVDLASPLSRSSSVVVSQLPRLDEQLPERVDGQLVATLTVGGDDLVFGLAAGKSRATVIADFVANLEATAAFFDDDERFPDGALLYVSQLYDPTDAAARTSDCATAVEARAASTLFKRVNGALVDTAVDRGFAAIDTHAHFLGHGVFADDPKSPFFDEVDPSRWLDDCFYPNDRGHHELRRLFWSAITGAPQEG